MCRKDGQKMNRMEVFVFSRRIEKGDRRGRKCGSANSAGVVTEITMVPMTAKAADYHTKTRDSLTAQSVTSLKYSGISSSTIIWSAHYVSRSLLSSMQPYLFIPPWLSDHSVTHRLSFSPFLLTEIHQVFQRSPCGSTNLLHDENLLQAQKG